MMCMAVLLFSAACKKNTKLTEEKTTSSITSPPTTPAPAPTPPVSTIPSYEVGTGSGNLTIDGNSLDLSVIKLIKIKAGNYNSVYVRNITSTASAPVSIKNNGQVVITGVMETNNINNVTIAGDNIDGLTYGIAFKNNPIRAIKMYGKMNGVTLKSMSFINVGDWCIAGEKDNSSGLAYDGTPNTRTDNFKILNCYFENTGAIAFGGTVKVGSNEDSGFYKDVEIAYNIFKNSPNLGSAAAFSNVQDYNIHHNVVDNVNANNNNHNGIFSMQGNGKFHDNKLTNYQGNAIRMWLYSRGSTPATNEIYNNICYNTRKYGAFELQGFSSNIWAGKTTYANAKIYNNTVGQMNTSKDWEGQILDLYNYGGSLEFYNNLGFILNRVGKETTDMINGNGTAAGGITLKNNIYKASWQDAVTDLTSFGSKISETGSIVL